MSDRDDVVRLGGAFREFDSPKGRAGSRTYLGRVVASGFPGGDEGKFIGVIFQAVGGPEAEGAAGTFTDLGTVHKKVYFIGPGTVAVGDKVICRYVGYRWVAKRKGSGVTCSGMVCFTVKKCDGSTAVVGAIITLTLGGTLVDTCTTDSSGQCCIDITSAATYSYTIVAAGYETKTGTVVATCSTNNVSLTFGASECVTVLGCKSLPLPNATVTIKSGGTTVATAITDGSGVACIQLLASTGSYSVEVSKSRFNTNTSTRTIVCGSTLTVFLASGGVAAGYHCSECADPIADTLYLTTPIGTSVVLTWRPDALIGAGVWEGFETRSIPNAWDCGTPQLFSTQSIVFTWQYVGTTIFYLWPACSAVPTHTGQNDPVQGVNTCGFGYYHVASNGPGAGSAMGGASISVPILTCSPFGMTGDFTPGNDCSNVVPGYIDMDYYLGTATVTE